MLTGIRTGNRQEKLSPEKLGLSADDAKHDAVIKKVCEAMGSSNRNKYRALFYAMLCKEFGKESVYS